MGKLNYEDVKSFIEYNKNLKVEGFSFPMLPRLNSVIGNIEQGQTHVITGMPSTGVSSFIDQNYVMSVLLQWYNTPTDERIPLKILYYTMSTPELKKLQLLLCSYLKLVKNLHVDVPTLNNQAGRLYDISKDKILLDAIDDASLFFNEIIDEGILVIQDKLVTPTEIYNDVVDYSDVLGAVDSTGSFVFNDGYEHAITLVIVDSVEQLLPDMEGYGTVYGDALDEKFKKIITEMKAMFNTTAVIAVPSKIGYVRSVKDTEPHLKHLGIYSKVADKGISIYNPIAEKNAKYYNADDSIYVTAKGNTLLRTWHVIRNVDGIDATWDRMFFLPGTSFLVEYDKNETITDINEVLDALSEESDFYIKDED